MVRSTVAQDQDAKGDDAGQGPPEQGTSEEPRTSWREMDKADVMAKMSAYQDKQRAKRDHKLTGEELELKLAERKRRRAQKKQGTPGQQREERRSMIVRSVAVGALLVVSCGFALGIKSTDSWAQDQVTQNTQRAAQLDDQIKQVTPEGSKEKRKAELEGQLRTAREQAEKVAGLQNEFATILYASNSEKPSNDGSPSKAFVDSAAHRKTLAPFFAQTSWIVTDEKQAYGPGSTVPFDEQTQIDPRFPWYVRYQSEQYEKGQQPKYQDPKTYTWAVSSVMPSSLDEPGVYEVTWTSTNKDGSLLAWATANYNASTKKFHALRVGETTQGHRLRVPVEYDPKAPAPEDKTGQQFPQKKDGEG